MAYPLTLGTNGSYVRVPVAERGFRPQVRFFLDFQRGAKFWDINYGSDLGLLEQEEDADAMVPVHLMVLRVGLSNYIKGITDVSLTWNKLTQGRTRKVEIGVAAQLTYARQVQSLLHENEIIWQS
jgi:hypothetical protein